MGDNNLVNLADARMYADNLESSASVLVGLLYPVEGYEGVFNPGRLAEVIADIEYRIKQIKRLTA